MRKAVEGVEDYAGLDTGPTFVGIDLDEGVHVLGEVEDNGVVDGLTGEAGAAAAGEDGDAGAAGDVDGGEDVVLVAGDDDADGFHLVDAGVGAVEDLREGVEADFAFDQLAEFLFQGAGF